ncbi:MAG: hypothetical protein IPM54_24960 [Polyangiaceae bacterium]|nr:hypothetical protein [Polyangiaceae bacterium]
MNLKRCRELYKAMVDGSARDDERREFLALLPAVFEAAEHDRRAFTAEDREDWILRG